MVIVIDDVVALGSSLFAADHSGGPLALTVSAGFHCLPACAPIPGQACRPVRIPCHGRTC